MAGRDGPPGSVAPDMTTFAELGIDDDLVDCLASQGIESPFPIQELTIPDAIAVAIRTPAGVVLHTGDIKLDQLPLAVRRDQHRAHPVHPAREPAHVCSLRAIAVGA